VTKIAISAAEVSGDLIGSTLIEALKKQDTDLQIEGLCGDKMQQSGCHKRWDMSLVNVMGYTEVLKKLPSLFRLRAVMVKYFVEQKPDVFIGVDAPDFNFVIEKKLKKQGIKTVHFVSPSIWAWRQYRVKKIKRSTDLVLCLFPFEVDFYKKHNQRAVFVGHPLAEKLTPRKNHTPSKEILLMPGSRTGEIKRLLPELLKTANIMLQQDSSLTFYLVLANDELLDLAKKLIGNQIINIAINQTHLRMQTADLALVASGTATLELALVGVPMVVVYKLSSISYFIASRLITVKHISLPNVITGKLLVPELIQNDANAVNIATHGMKILTNNNTDLIKEFNQIHQNLSCNASEKSAKLILEFINE
jgi:lipid-A-disaccharide synthase